MRDRRHGSGAGPTVKASAGSRGCQASLRREYSGRPAPRYWRWRCQPSRSARLPGSRTSPTSKAFGTQGTRMDVTVSALGDSKNLQGGTLLVTPLLGADGNVYAVAQGSVAVGGFQAEGEAAKITRGVPTVGRIANGAIIEREIEFALNRLPNVRLALRNADFTTAKRIAAAVNDFLGVQTAEPIDPSTVQLSIPAEFKGNVVAFLTEIEQLQVDPDLPAKALTPMRYGRPDHQLADALTKVSPQAQTKAKASSQDFEAVFLNSMFSQMTSGIKGEGPFGDTPGTGVWRSMLTEEYSKSFAKTGGIGISNEVYRTLILQQASRAQPGQGKQP